jgi:hypothetical protein
LEVWTPLIQLSKKIEGIFDDHYNRNSSLELFDGWKDNIWSSKYVRKCHLKTIDNRESQKLWLMHVNIFPHEHFNFPILGFDIVAGPSKITGSFFDFSPTTDETPEHPYLSYMRDTVKDLSWSKPRDLPDWAQSIFSTSMIAAGNLKSQEEIDQLSKTCLHLVEYYVTNMKSNLYVTNPIKITERHNQYCRNQKLNPHLHRSILSMGISENDKNNYIDSVLFEEI